MSVKEREEVIDLDFTYGEEYLHLKRRGSSKRLCGAPSNGTHSSHGVVARGGFPAPKNCFCGAPICPVCEHIHNHELGR